MVKNSPLLATAALLVVTAAFGGPLGVPHRLNSTTAAALLPLPACYHYQVAAAGKYQDFWVCPPTPAAQLAGPLV